MTGSCSPSGRSGWETSTATTAPTSTWEGSLKRFNGNVGTVTVQSNTLFANYGVTNRLNVLTLVPYVWTKTSQGELHSMQGAQDLTLAAKYSFLEFPTTRIGAVRAMAVASGVIPLTDYTPDFAPLSIGTASKRLAGRFTSTCRRSRVVRQRHDLLRVAR